MGEKFGNTPRVKEILSWYESDNPGVKTNISRLLNAGWLGGTGKFVILPVDQGFEHGPARSFAANPAGYDPNYHFELALAAGCNAYAAPLGFIEAAANRHAGEIPLILKINNHDVLHDEKDPLPAWAVWPSGSRFIRARRTLRPCTSNSAKPLPRRRLTG
jgi:class I fructose-bisphosphate aldolase